MRENIRFILRMIGRLFGIFLLIGIAVYGIQFARTREHEYFEGLVIFLLVLIASRQGVKNEITR